MASFATELLTDDLNPEVTENVQTVTFFDPITGDQREIELGETNARELNKVLAGLDKYIEASREVKVKKAKPVKNDENAKIREWAQANGYPIGDRGRIKSDIVDAYHKAQAALSNPDTDAQAAGDAPVQAPATSDEIMDLLDEVTGNVDTEKASE